MLLAGDSIVAVGRERDLPPCDGVPVTDMGDAILIPGLVLFWIIGLVAAVLAVAGQNDEILMTRPCYFNHESTLGMLEIGIDYVDCEASNGMLPRLEDIAAAIGPFGNEVIDAAPPLFVPGVPVLHRGVFDLSVF